MMILFSLILLITVAASEGASLQGEWVSPSITYWHEKLPTTAIPETLWELISDDGEKLKMVVGKGGVNVNTGMPPRKTEPPALKGDPTKAYWYAADEEKPAAMKDKAYWYVGDVQKLAALKDKAYIYAADAQKQAAPKDKAYIYAGDEQKLAALKDKAYIYAADEQNLAALNNKAYIYAANEQNLAALNNKAYIYAANEQNLAAPKNKAYWYAGDAQQLAAPKDKAYIYATDSQKQAATKDKAYIYAVDEQKLAAPKDKAYIYAAAEQNLAALKDKAYIYAADMQKQAAPKDKAYIYVVDEQKLAAPKDTAYIYAAAEQNLASPKDKAYIYVADEQNLAAPKDKAYFYAGDAQKLAAPKDKAYFYAGDVQKLAAPKDKAYWYAADGQKMAAPKGKAYRYAADAQMPTDPSFLMFLLEKDLHNGTKTSLRLVQEGQKRHFLPRTVADKIPFSSDKISVALKELNIEQDSDIALAMQDALETCETPAVKGESKYCATSLESMIDYVTSRLGSNRITVLETSVPKTSKSGKQEYSIEGVKYESKPGEKLVACHREKYAYAVYYCHETKGTRTARVWVRGEDGSKVEVLAVCHEDTTAWSPNFVAFKLLNVKPGASICHFLPQAHVVWQLAN